MGIDGSENAAFFAELFGCNERTIQRLAKDGKVPKQGRGRYPVYETISGYIQHISEGKTDSGGQIQRPKVK